MTALWIRVGADEVSSVRVARLAEALELKPVYTLGHLTALGGKVAAHAPDGSIGEVPDLLLEQWAGWDGQPRAFAKAFRTIIAPEGRILDWTDTMGKLVERQEKDRKRKGRGHSAEVPRNNSGDSTPTGRDVTGRDVRDGRDERLDGDGDLLAIPRARDAADSGAVAVPSAAQPPGTATSTATPDLPPATRELIAQAYARATPSRIADVQVQATATLSTRGAKLERGVFVHAVDATHLNTASRTVLEQLRTGQLRDPDKAIRVLLQVLRETWPEANAAHEKAQIQTEERTRGRANATAIGTLIPGQIRRHA